jgi:hypothetical protein
MQMLRVTMVAAFSLTLAACGSRLYPTAENTLSASIEKPAAATYLTLDNAADATFNQLLGINDKGIIAGYYGSGAKRHPNKGYTLRPPYAQTNYVNENYPGSLQTQATGINLGANTSCFWVSGDGSNFGCVQWNGVFSLFVNPNTGSGKVNQLLAINNGGVAAGFYMDGKGVSHGYTVNQASRTFAAVAPPNATNVTASGINDNGDVTGFYMARKNPVGFLKTGSKYVLLNYPGAAGTTPLGINNSRQIVGAYVDAAGKTHGFLVSNLLKHAKWQSFDAPKGRGATTINGLNNKGDLVGFYTDKKGLTHGLLIRL